MSREIDAATNASQPQRCACATQHCAETGVQTAATRLSECARWCAITALRSECARCSFVRGRGGDDKRSCTVRLHVSDATQRSLVAAFAFSFARRLAAAERGARKAAARADFGANTVQIEESKERRHGRARGGFVGAKNAAGPSFFWPCQSKCALRNFEIFADAVFT